MFPYQKAFVIFSKHNLKQGVESICSVNARIKKTIYSLLYALFISILIPESICDAFMVITSNQDPYTKSVIGTIYIVFGNKG